MAALAKKKKKIKKGKDMSKMKEKEWKFAENQELGFKSLTQSQKTHSRPQPTPCL